MALTINFYLSYYISYLIESSQDKSTSQIIRSHIPKQQR